VLVADDSETVRAVLRLELVHAGYQVVEATNGQEAVELARQYDVAVVLLDVEMPVLDGHQALAALKADEATRDIPVVFLSGRGAGDDLVQALREGAHDYLRKPPEPAELLARVGAANRIKELQGELRRRAEELDLVSRTDYLTGLSNRRHVEEHLRAALAASVRHGHTLAVLLLDIDHFKRVNDEGGHAAGDEVLGSVARTLVSAVRLEDLVGRWGGEEFIVVATNTAEHSAAALAERLRHAVESSTPVTVSIGGSWTPAPADRLIAAADANLYAAKDAGRNRVVVDGPPPPVV
jgi:diguanylate cyclase (GGDEF)-like protein